MDRKSGKSNTSEYLEASAISKEKIIRLKKLTLEYTRAYSLDIHPKGKLQMLQFEIRQGDQKHQCENR